MASKYTINNLHKHVSSSQTLIKMESVGTQVNFLHPLNVEAKTI